MDRPTYKITGLASPSPTSKVEIIDPYGNDIAKFCKSFKVEQGVNEMPILTLKLFADVELNLGTPVVKTENTYVKDGD